MKANNKSAQVQTSIDGIVHDAATVVDFDPDQTEAVSASITSDGELQLKLVELDTDNGGEA